MKRKEDANLLRGSWVYFLLVSKISAWLGERASSTVMELVQNGNVLGKTTIDDQLIY